MTEPDENETAEEPVMVVQDLRPRAEPGVIVVLENGEPVSRPVRYRDGKLVLGRGPASDVVLNENAASRSHAEILTEGAEHTVRDLESRNGTVADGILLARGEKRRFAATVRIGRSIVTVDADLARFNTGVVAIEHGRVQGPWMRVLDSRIGHAAAARWPLLIHGESGSGKDHVARRYRELGPNASGPFVVVNCATIPNNLADAMLFGTRKGAFTGAVDQPGKFVAANGGVIFLDEVAELDLGVQAKLLHVLESGEVIPLGADHGRRTEVRVCAATHVELEDAIRKGRFRHDLYRRLARVVVHVPPLRARREEIPFLVRSSLDAAYQSLSLRRLQPSVLFYEECIARDWRGNVRELVAAMSHAILMAAADSAATELQPFHLPPDDDDGDTKAEESTHKASALPEEPEPLTPALQATLRELLELLRRNGSDLASAAKTLGFTKSYGYRLLRRAKIRLPLP